MKRLLAGLLSFVLVVTVMCFSAPQTKVEAADSLDDLYEKLSDLEKRQKSLEKQKAQAYKEEQQELKRINLLSNEIGALEEQIDTLDAILKQLDSQLEAKNKELSEAEKQLADYYEVFKNRIRTIYEQGDISYLEVLLQSKDFSDFLIRVDLVNELMEYDNNMLAAMKDKRAAVEDIRNALSENLAKQEKAKRSVEAQKSSLSKKRAESRTLVSKLTAEQRKLAKQIDEAHKAIEKLNEAIDKLIDENSNYVGGSLMWPVPGKSYISSYFGYRNDPFTGVRKFHNGIDIPAPKGHPIVAANRGTVVASAYDSYGAGYYVVIDHGGGLSTRYYHCSKLLVKKGQSVSKGQTIAHVGSTGYSTGPHLHFTVRKNKVDQNPLNYVRPPS